MQNGNSAINELLLCCSRTTNEHKMASRIRVLLEQRIDWDYSIRIATIHQVTPLFYRTLRATAPERVPRPVLDHLKTLYIANAARNLFLTQELITLLTLFHSHDVLTIPYKGPVLAASIYGDIAYRQFADLDVLVHELDFHLKVDNLLVSKGWQLSHDFGWEKTFKDASGRVAIDVHKSVTHRQMPVRQNFHRLWQRSKTVSVLDEGVRTFSPEDLLIILCIQMVKDVSANRLVLAKICDIAELIRRHQVMDWEWVTEEAGKLGVLHILYLALMSTNDLLGTTLPKEVSHKADDVPNLAAHVAHVKECVLGKRETTLSRPELLDPTIFHFHSRERLRDSVNPTYEYIITPNEYDFMFVRLPRRLFFLYYIIRPIRLVYKYGLKGLVRFFFARSD